MLPPAPGELNMGIIGLKKAAVLQIAKQSKKMGL